MAKATPRTPETTPRASTSAPHHAGAPARACGVGDAGSPGGVGAEEPGLRHALPGGFVSADLSRAEVGEDPDAATRERGDRGRVGMVGLDHDLVIEGQLRGRRAPVEEGEGLRPLAGDRPKARLGAARSGCKNLGVGSALARRPRRKEAETEADQGAKGSPGRPPSGDGGPLHCPLPAQATPSPLRWSKVLPARMDGKPLGAAPLDRAAAEWRGGTFC